MHQQSTKLQPLHSLREVRDLHEIRIKLNIFGNIGDLKGVELYIGDESWQVLVDDEYNDLIEDHQLMCLFLVLRELETYLTEPDFLKWCMQNGSDASDFHLLQYYRELGRSVYEIEKRIGTIDSRISSLDYELRTGIIHELIQAK